MLTDAASPDVARLWGTLDAAAFLRRWAVGGERSPQAEHTGNRLVDVPMAGRVQMRWEPPPALANLAGVVHGGYVGLVCDEAAGLAAASTGERFVPMLTLDLQVHFLRPVVPGQTYEAWGDVLHGGRSRVVADARVVGDDGSLVATARGSFLPNRAAAEALAAAAA